MSKKRKTNYDKYKATYELAKSEHRLKIGARMLTKYEYDRVYEQTRYDKNDLSPKEVRKLIMDAQAIDRDRAVRAYKEYKKAIYDPFMKNDKEFKGVWISDDTYWGRDRNPWGSDREKGQKLESAEDEAKIGRHTTLAGFMRDKHAVHFMISTEIMNGRSREEVLADYGY